MSPTSTPDDRPLRVLHVGKFYPPHMGGIETHLHALCTALHARGVDVRVVVASDDKRTTSEVLDGVPVTRLGTPMNLAAAPINPGLAAAIRESGADVVHVHLPHPAATISYLTSRHRGPLVATYHSDIVRQKVMGAAYEPVQHRFLSRCAGIIATSPNYLATSPVLARHKERCHVIPYGIALDHFEHADPAKVAELRRRFGDRVVISVGRLIYYKGFEFLIDAMKEVRGKLLIVGSGPLRAALEQRARDAGIADRVELLGEIQNVDTVPYYHAADVFALASIARSEAFGIVQIEAMACGRPVINTSLDSGVPFVSLDGVSGLTVPPQDPPALAAAINRLLDDAELRRRLGEGARQRARAEFAVEKMTDRVMALYRSVTGSARASGGRPAAAAAR